MFGRQAAMAPPALNVPALAVAIAVPLVGGIALGVSTRGSIDGWYKKIKKPTWNPVSYSVVVTTAMIMTIWICVDAQRWF